jgi:hypothetical protein
MNQVYCTVYTFKDLRKKKLDRGEPSKGMTAARATRLTALGFVWGVNDAAWEAQLARLTAYQAAHGDCDVPQRHADDLQLGRWVAKQRKCKKKLDRGEAPCEGMTAERAAWLMVPGFVWVSGRG